jgi:transcriptional regulator with XRE-family HTH domain
MTITYAEQSRPVRPPGARDGREVKARRERIGMKIYELAEAAGVNKDTLSDWERGKRNPHPDTIEAVLTALDKLEEEMGIDTPPATQAKPGMLRFEVTGVYGADALVVEGPIENLRELEAMIDRIMRGGRRSDDTSDE